MKNLILFICIAINGFSYAQEKVEKVILLDSVPVSEAFILLEKAFNVKISYADKTVSGKTIFLDKKSQLKEVLNVLSKKLNLNFEFINDRYIVVTEKDDFTFLDETTKLSEILINSYLAKGITKNKNASFIIKPKELEILPGLIEADVLESLLELPGVISPNETATGLNVRGGTPDQNQIIWDGITIYHSGHFFGMVSNFNPNITNDVVFLNKGVNPKYGERISSVINISTKNKVAEKINIGGGFNGISADIFAEVPIIKDKLSVLVSFRKTYHKLFDTSSFEKIEDKVFQSTEIHSTENSEDTFYFKDQTIKLNYAPNKNNNFSVSYIHIDNDLEHYNENLKNNDTYLDVLDTENNGLSGSWNKIWNPKIKQTIAFSASDFSLNYNYLTFKDSQQNSDFDKRNFVKNTTISTEVNVDLGSQNSALFGFQSVFKDVSYSFKETVHNLKYILDENSNQLNTYSFFTNYKHRTFSFFDFNVGLRANYYRELDEFRIEPRIIILKEIYKNLKMQFTGDIRNQTIHQIDETLISNLSLENKLWRLSDGDNSPIINSQQITVGFLYDHLGWSFDLDTYFKINTGISALKLGFLSSDQNQYNIGDQKISGLDFYLKKDFKHIKSWVSYSFTDIKNKFPTLNNNDYFTANNQIQHAISSSIAYKTRKVQIALGWKWHSGSPYTLSETTALNNTVFNQGINTGRLPNYNRFDFSSIYHFSFSEKSKLQGKIGLSVRNLLDKRNLITREYLGNNTPNSPISQVDRFSLRRTTNFVFRVEW
jgi:hypothetical protein